MKCSTEIASGADVDFLRNIGIALVVLVALTGSISVMGVINSAEVAPEPDFMASAEPAALKIQLPSGGTSQLRVPADTYPR